MRGSREEATDKTEVAPCLTAIATSVLSAASLPWGALPSDSLPVMFHLPEGFAAWERISIAERQFLFHSLFIRYTVSNISGLFHSPAQFFRLYFLFHPYICKASAQVYVCPYAFQAVQGIFHAGCAVRADHSVNHHFLVVGIMGWIPVCGPLFLNPGAA